MSGPDWELPPDVFPTPEQIQQRADVVVREIRGRSDRLSPVAVCQLACVLLAGDGSTRDGEFGLQFLARFNFEQKLFEEVLTSVGDRVVKVVIASFGLRWESQKSPVTETAELWRENWLRPHLEYLASQQQKENTAPEEETAVHATSPTVELLLYFPDMPELPPLPEFPDNSKARLRAATARCQHEALDGMRKLWPQVAPPACRGPSGSYEQFISIFDEYGTCLHRAYAKELASLVGDRSKYVTYLENTLPWLIARRIAPLQDFVFYDSEKERQGEQKVEYGDWWGLIHRSWQSFHHPNHDKLSPAINRRFTAVLLDSPNQQRVCEEMRLKLMSLALELLSETLNADLAVDQLRRKIPSGASPTTTEDSETSARDFTPSRPGRAKPEVAAWEEKQACATKQVSTQTSFE